MTEEGKTTSVAFAVGGSVDSGKCFDPYTSIIMYNGDTKYAKDINVGDILIGDDFNKRTVLETHCGNGEMFEIETSDKKKYITNGKHVLCLKNNLNEIIEISVNDFVNLPFEKQNTFKWYRTDVDFKYYENNVISNDDTDPYTFGLWIGKEYFYNNLLSNTNQTVIDHGNSDLSVYFSSVNLVEKHIPNIYKFSSKENRLKLLAGIIDINYYYYGTDNQYTEIFLSNKKNMFRLMNDIIFVINSLGLTVYENNLNQMCNHHKISFGGINQKNIPCKYKKIKNFEFDNNMMVNISIKSLGTNNYCGFQVTENGRFLLEDFSVVHNSSLIGVLISSVLDNGDGSARKLVAKHPHEIKSGKTSDISTRTYDVPNSNKGVTLIDLCGHESYFRTTTFGVSGLFPDYAFLIVSANKEILPMTKQHLRLLLSLSIPIIIIVTHIDIAPEDIYKNTINGINKICTMYAGKLVTTKCVNGYDDINKSSEEIEKLEKQANDIILQSITSIADGKQIVFPIVTISNKTGFFMNTIRKILEDFPIRDFWLPGSETAVLNNKLVKLFKMSLERQKEGLSSILPKYKEFSGGIFYVDCAYSPPGIGLVVTGINRGDSINTGDFLYMGPFGKEFRKIRVKSLHNNMRQVIPRLNDHNRGCINFAVSDKIEIRKEQIDKGIILLNSLNMVKSVCYRFKAVFTIFTNATNSITLKNGYTPVIHLYTIRQSARMFIDPLENNGQDIITFDGTNNMVVIATFKFKQHPEFIEPYNRFILRNGAIQGIGLIISILPISEDIDGRPDPVKNSRSRFRNKPKPKILKA